MIRSDRTPHPFSDKNQTIIVKKLPAYIKILIKRNGSTHKKLREMQLSPVTKRPYLTNFPINNRTSNRQTSQSTITISALQKTKKTSSIASTLSKRSTLSEARLKGVSVHQLMSLNARKTLLNLIKSKKVVLLNATNLDLMNLTWRRRATKWINQFRACLTVEPCQM